VVTVDALRPHLVAGLAARQEPEPVEYLQGDPRVPDLQLTVELNGEVISEVRLADALYWTPAQQLAHVTVNGASTRPGDLIASGTLSGPDPATGAGSLIERGGGFLEDGDRVCMRGWVGEGDRRVGFGVLDGTIVSGGVHD
jgi:fumarylacetoacetase